MPVFLLVCLLACLHVYLSVFLHACLPACLPVCLLVYLPVCLPASLSACLYICLLACLPASLSVILPTCLVVCLHSLQLQHAGNTRPENVLHSHLHVKPAEGFEKYLKMFLRESSIHYTGMKGSPPPSAASDTYLPAGRRKTLVLLSLTEKCCHVDTVNRCHSFLFTRSAVAPPTAPLKEAD